MNIQNLLNLPSVPLPERDNLPGSTGIYFAVTKNECLYIGQARNFRKRWQQHHRLDEVSQWDDVRIAWMSITEPGILDDLEIALIRYFRPVLNYQGQNSVLTSGKPIGEPYFDMLKVEAWLKRRTMAAEGSSILCSRLMQREEYRRRLVTELARKRGVAFEQMWDDILCDRAEYLTPAEYAQMQSPLSEMDAASEDE